MHTYTYIYIHVYAHTYIHVSTQTHHLKFSYMLTVHTTYITNLFTISSGSSGEAASSVEINKGIGGRRAAVGTLAAVVAADIKVRRQRNEGEQQSQRERKRADRKSTEEHSETTWQQGIARRTAQASPGVCTCRWTEQESLTYKEDTDESDAVSIRRRTERKRSRVLWKKPRSRMLSVPADGLSGRESVCYRRNWRAACRQYPPMD